MSAIGKTLKIRLRNRILTKLIWEDTAKWLGDPTIPISSVEENPIDAGTIQVKIKVVGSNPYYFTIKITEHI